MKNVKNENGFSLIELLIVVVVIGTLAAIGIPLLRKGIVAAENGSTYAVAKIMVQEQFNYYAQNNRYARLDELNTQFSGNFGLTQGNDIKRGKYTFELQPIPNPTDTDLKDNFTIKASRTLDGADNPFVIIVDASGNVEQVLP